MGAAVQPSPPLLLAFCASEGVSVLPIVVKGEKKVLAARGAAETAGIASERRQEATVAVGG